jgi:hypothetical protein
MPTRLRTDRRRRRAIEVQHDKPGMGEAFWAERKAIAEDRMGAIDASPRPWRYLVYEFGLEPVVHLAKMGMTDAGRARGLLERRRA